MELIKEISLGNIDVAKILLTLLDVDPMEGEKALIKLKEIRRNLTNDQIRWAFEITCEGDPTRFLVGILNGELFPC